MLAVDLPSGLDADTGTGAALRATYTLSLLTLEARSVHRRRARCLRRRSGSTTWACRRRGITRAPGWPAPPAQSPRLHASHKGSYGDVAVIGGAPGMAGAALLAASAALHAGAGRVFAALLDDASLAVDAALPDLMFRPWDSLDLAAMSVACGCGGGDAVRAVLPKVLSTLARAGARCRRAELPSPRDTQLQSLLQARSRRGRATVLTPHPLEAARLLGCDRGAGTSRPAGRRPRTGRSVSAAWWCSRARARVIAAPEVLPLINPTGNARLATAGTGDVLAGMIAARLAAGVPRSKPRPVRSTSTAWRRTHGRRPAADRLGARASHPGLIRHRWRRLDCGSAADAFAAQPRPTKGILVAITVWNSTLASSGRLAM